MRKVILERLRAESLAIVGLLVALLALGYNTWRNELTEQNQTVRLAGFEMLLKVGELQSVLYSASSPKQAPEEATIRGEIVVLSLRDLSMFMPESVQSNAQSLMIEWRKNNQTLTEGSSFSVALVDTKLNELRLGIISAVRSLE